MSHHFVAKIFANKACSSIVGHCTISKYPATQWRLIYCKVRMQQHELSCSVTILYHWLRLHTFPSPARFFLNYLSFSYIPPLLSSALLLESWSPLFLSLLLLNFCPTLRNFYLLFRTSPSFNKLTPTFTRRFHPLFSYN